MNKVVFMKMETGCAIESLLLFNIFKTTEICISVPNGFQERPDFLQDLPPLSAGFIFSTRSSHVKLPLKQF